MATLTNGDKPIEIALRRSAQARRLSLRVSSLDGRVTLTLPARMREAEGLAFARSREDWIRAALSRLPPVQAVALGTALPVEGREVRLIAGPSRGAVTRLGDTLAVPGDPALAGRRVAVWLKFLAQERLTLACARHEAALGRSRSRLVLRDTRSRWGSCSAAGVLMFNWRLVMAPPEVLDYVAAHEVAHLAEMNHSPRYWAVVKRLMPGYAEPRQWLKSQGTALHGWRFDG
jgi:predicted metal-dependent hydrolase